MKRETPEETKSDLQSSPLLLEKILDHQHALYQLADRLNWDYLIQNFGEFYAEDLGRPSIPIRVVAGLHYIKYLENESDESVVEKFCENPYWQYFCGFKTFQHRFPCHPTTLIKWRKKVGIKGVEKLLEETINTARRESFIDEKSCQRLNIDTTVQEKSITFPTDSKLCFRMREKLVSACERRGILLRQTYVRVAKSALFNQSRYRAAGHYKRAEKENKKLKNYLGRVIRDIERKLKGVMDEELSSLVALGERVLNQKKEDKNKIYSLHALEVECIAKGKVNKKYEFGCKVSLATTAKEPWVVAIQAQHGNPYDGHTLKSTLSMAEQITGVAVEAAFVDKGYRGKQNYPEGVQVCVSGKKRGLSRVFQKLLKSRSGIEPIIGHLKNDHRLSRNYLLGKIGDGINAVLSGCAFNLRKLLRCISFELRQAGVCA